MLDRHHGGYLRSGADGFEGGITQNESNRSHPFACCVAGGYDSFVLRTAPFLTRATRGPVAGILMSETPGRVLRS